MKYSQPIGIIVAILVVISCFCPWIEVPSIHKILNGVDGKVNESFYFGKQIIPHTFFCGIAILLFLIPKIGAKRTNIFITFLNFSWAIKNFILFKMCRPECPTVRYGIWLLVIFSFLTLLMSLLPKIDVSKK